MIAASGQRFTFQPDNIPPVYGTMKRSLYL